MVIGIDIGVHDKLYNKDVSFDLTKTKALLMASTCKVTFNIENLIIHLTLNISFQ
jgi:hypothetical protein